MISSSQTRDFSPQDQVLDISNEIKVGFSPIDFDVTVQHAASLPGCGSLVVVRCAQPVRGRVRRSGIAVTCGELAPVFEHVTSAPPEWPWLQWCLQQRCPRCFVRCPFLGSSRCMGPFFLIALCVQRVLRVVTRTNHDV